MIFDVASADAGALAERITLRSRQRAIEKAELGLHVAHYTGKVLMRKVTNTNRGIFMARANRNDSLQMSDIHEIRRRNYRKILSESFGNIAAAFAKKIGVAPSMLSRIFSSNTKEQRNIGHAMARRMELAANKPRGWLDQDHESLTATNYRQCPLLDWKFCLLWVDRLGGKVGNLPPGVTQMVCPVEAGPRTFCLRVEGTSSHNPAGAPSLDDGEIIYVDPDVGHKHQSVVVVQLLGKETPVLRQTITEGGETYLRALNPDWPDGITKLSADARILGVVVGKFGKM